MALLLSSCILCLPPSLRCLSLTLPHKTLTARLMSALPTQCPHLTHCHVSHINDCSDTDEEDEFSERREGLQDQLGEAVWCDHSSGVEKQRLDRRWQREVGVLAFDQ